MTVHPSFVEYAVVLLLGLTAGLLARFLIALACAIVAAVGLVWLLGYLSASQVGRGVAALGSFLSGLGLRSQLLFTVTGAVFVAGLCSGVLLTSRLRAFDASPGA